MRPTLAVVATLVLAVAIPGLARSQPAPDRPFVWIEGEAAAATSFNRHSWYCCQDLRRDLLSPGTPGGAAGDWLVHYANDGQPATAEYRFDAPVAGRYALWLRVSAYTVRMRYRLDAGSWVRLDTASDPRELMNLLTPSKIDIRFLAWVAGGELDLAAGEHRLTIEVSGHPERHGGNEVHGGIDVLALAAYPWTPAGAMKPGQEPVPGPAGWFPLVAEDDPFSPASITDLSRGAPGPAGRHGPVQVAGDDLAFADGTPVKFWGLDAAPAANEALQGRQARYYAKNGVNLVRLHPVEGLLGLLAKDPGTGERIFDPARLDRLDRWFAVLKEQGIYSDWSVFYPHVITPDDGYDPQLYAELQDNGIGKSTSGMVAFMRPLQDAEWEYLRRLLAHTNPYTGLRYADDPALAFVEVHNEDSVFFHAPLNDLEPGTKFPRHTAELQRQWMTWLQGRYANDAALLAAWGPSYRGSRPGDSLTNPRMAIYGAWEMTAVGPVRNGAERRRMGDFIRFLAETQRAYYERRGAELRAAGYRGLRVTTAWQAGGPAAALANLWTDDALDVVDRHRYFGGDGSGGYRINPGPVSNASHLATPGGGILGAGFEQVEGKPFMMTEWTQSPPNQWKAEIAPFMAFYGLGLQGWDASLHFAGSLPRMGSGWPGLDSFVTETPHYLGQFPALALAIRRGDLRAGSLAAARRVALADAFGGVDALSQTTPSGGWGAGSTGGNLSTPLDTLAIGRVTLKVADGQPRSERNDWPAFVQSGTITSTTGELVWDSTARIVTVRSPRTQAIIGFAAGRTIELPDLSVTVRDTPFVSLLVTALDDRPLSESGHILVTALARDQQLGARYNADGTQLENLGGPPLMLEPVQATLTFKGRTVTSARVVDIHGVPQDREVERSGNAIVIDGRYTTYYYEVRTDAPDVDTATPPPTATPGASPGATSTPGSTPGSVTPSPASPATPSPATTPSAPPPWRSRLFLPITWRGGE